MNIFGKKQKPRYSIKATPSHMGYEVSLLTPYGNEIPLSFDIISTLPHETFDEKILRTLSILLQQANRFQYSADSNDLSEDINEVFTKEEIERPLFGLENGRLNISNLCIAAARSGNLSDIVGISYEDISKLSIPEYGQLKAKMQAHGGVENPNFALELEILDLNGAPKRLKPIIGHTYSDDEGNTILVSPYLHRLICRYQQHKETRKSDQYKISPQIRFQDLSELRRAALNAEIRIDPFVKAQNVIFLKTLPYVLGRGPDERVHLNPALPEEHSDLDRGFQAVLEENHDDIRPVLINLKDEKDGIARVVLSDEAWNDVKKIRRLKAQGQGVLEDVFEDPVKFFGRKPRTAISGTFADRVSGFVIGKLTSNRADSRSGNDWGDGYEGRSALLRATDGSTIPLNFIPAPPEYTAIKRACMRLSEIIDSQITDLREESGAILTPVPDQTEKRIYVTELKGEFNLSELETCCRRIEYANRTDIEPEHEAKARETLQLAEENNALVVEWGVATNGSSILIPVASLRASLPQRPKDSSDRRVSLAIDDLSTRLGRAPDWHYLTCDLGAFAKPPYFRESFSLESHQQKGFAWLTWIFEHSIDRNIYPHRGALLADDMGLGKTVQLLSFVAWLRTQEVSLNKPILIVAPVSLIQSSWLDDGFNKFFTQESVLGIVSGGLGPIVKFSDCPIKIDRALLLAEAQRVNHEMSSSSKTLGECEIDIKLKEQLQQINLWAKGKIVITSYETLRVNSLALGSIDFSAVILDEAQKIKNVGVLQSNAAKALKADMCIAMTGTPIENSLMDLWSIMDFVLPGHLGSASEFRERFVNPVKRATPDTPERQQLREQLEKALSPVWFRRTKREVFKEEKSLPPIHHYDQIQDGDSNRNVHQVQMSELQFSIYETQLAYFISAPPGHRLPVIRAMIEACAAPWLASDEPLRWENQEKIFSLAPKLEMTISILDQIRKRSDSAGRKVVIFANIIEVQLGLAFFIFEWNKATGGAPIEVEVYNGEATPKARADMLTRFKMTPGFQVLIISPKAGGAGLNIVEANNVIHYTREWNPALERQATDRVYRMGQNKPVHVYYPTTSLSQKGMLSAEERLANILVSKRDLMDDFTVSASDHNITETELGSFSGNSDQGDKPIKVENIHLLDPYSFECLIACLFEKQGYEAHWCGQSGDQGADVLALHPTIPTLIQVKHTQTNKHLGTAAIKEVRGAKSHYESKLKRSLKLMAATNFRFHERAIQLAREGDPVELIEFSRIRDLLNQFTVTAKDIEIKKAKGKFRL